MSESRISYHDLLRATLSQPLALLETDYLTLADFDQLCRLDGELRNYSQHDAFRRLAVGRSLITHHLERLDRSTLDSWLDELNQTLEPPWNSEFRFQPSKPEAIVAQPLGQLRELILKPLLELRLAAFATLLTVKVLPELFDELLWFHNQIRKPELWPAVATVLTEQLNSHPLLQLVKARHQHYSDRIKSLLTELIDRQLGQLSSKELAKLLSSEEAEPIERNILILLERSGWPTKEFIRLFNRSEKFRCRRIIDVIKTRQDLPVDFLANCVRLAFSMEALDQTDVKLAISGNVSRFTAENLELLRRRFKKAQYGSHEYVLFEIVGGSGQKSTALDFLTKHQQDLSVWISRQDVTIEEANDLFHSLPADDQRLTRLARALVTKSAPASVQAKSA